MLRCLDRNLLDYVPMRFSHNLYVMLDGIKMMQVELCRYADLDNCLVLIHMVTFEVSFSIRVRGKYKYYF